MFAARHAFLYGQCAHSINRLWSRNEVKSRRREKKVGLQAQRNTKKIQKTHDVMMCAVCSTHYTYYENQWGRVRICGMRQ